MQAGKPVRIKKLHLFRTLLSFILIKNTLFMFKSYLLSFFILFIVFSCRSSQDEQLKDGVGIVQINIKGIEFQGDPNIATNNKQASAFKFTNLGTFSPENEVQEIGRAHIKDDYYAIATYSPGIDSEVPISSKASASTKASADPNLTNTLPAGIKYRVVVYNLNGDLITQKVYTTGTKLSDDGKALQLDSGRYKFVVYSYNTTTAPPAIDGKSAIVSPPANIDLLYYSKEVSVNGDTTNYLDIVLAHKYTGISLVLNGADVGVISAVSGVTIAPNHANNQLNLSDGSITYDSNPVNLAIGSDKFSGFNTTTVTSSTIIVSAPASEAGIPNATLTIDKLTAAGTDINKMRFNFYIKPGNSGKVTVKIARVPQISNIVQMASSWYNTIVLTKSGDVYGTGHIDYGELGTGLFDLSERYTSFPVPPSDLYVTKFFKLNTGITGGVKRIAESEGSSYLLSNAGELFVAGRNRNGQLGIGNTTNTGREGGFKKVNFAGGVIIKDIAAGKNQSYILTTAGRVLATGVNSYGQLGVGDTSDRNNFVPVAGIPSDEVVEQIVAGEWHVVVKTVSGKIYASGDNSYGQISGLGSQTSFKEIPFTFGTIKSISAGSYTTFILTTDGKLYACGYNGNGELGVGNTSNQSNLTLVTSVSNVKEVHSYFEHSIAITNSGSLFVTGRNRYGQLGLGDTVSRSSFTENTTLVDPIVGSLEGASAYHTIVIGRSGRVYAAGYNGYAAFGLGNFTSTNSSLLLLPLTIAPQ
ncbi:chromosome condensation regulator RCC1 [Elizabethkingia anophelis]|nr:chromosome condensation regulator RCC1 [Elizabethkingia anophelis]